MSLMYRPGSGDWSPVPNSRYQNEEELRTLLVETPAILPLDELPGVESTLQVTVGREAPLGSGYADIIWVDTEGVITIIEVKLRANPEVRREVLAQALSYGAFLEGMSVKEFTDRIARPYLQGALKREMDGLDLPAMVSQLPLNDRDAERFQSGLERSLQVGDFRILIVVDEPHQQLRRSVAYVNRHADFEIYLVEVGFYKSADGTHEVLAPRILDLDTTRNPTGGAGSGRKIQQWDIDSYFEQVHSEHPNVEQPLRALMGKLEGLESKGLVEFDFGTGNRGNRLVRFPGIGTSMMFILSTGSIKVARGPMQDTGFTEDEITAFMDRIAELSGTPKTKYTSGWEAEIVSPEALLRDGVVGRVVEVVEAIAKEFDQNLRSRDT